MGDQFGSDGRMIGDVDVKTITCVEQICDIPVKAPSLAIVYLSQQALAEVTPAEGVQTFAVTAATVCLVTFTAHELRVLSKSVLSDVSFRPVDSLIMQRLRNTATVDQAVLATSNGRGGGDLGSEQMGTTSTGSANGAFGLRDAIPGVLALACVGLGALVAMGR